MNTRLLHAFLAVHQSGSVVAAAAKVHLSPAAVSAQLKSLEELLGLQLFERGARAITPTPVARRLVPLAEQVLATCEQMRSLRADGVLSGRLRLGVISSALAGVLPSLLAGLTQAHPRLEIKVTAGNSVELLHRVERRELDCALVTEPIDALPPELVAHPLYAEPFVLLSPAGGGEGGWREQLRSHPYVAFDRGTWAGRLIDAYLVQAGIQVQASMELDSLEAIMAVVRHGLGVSIVPLIRGAPWHDSGLLRLQPLEGFERRVSLVEPRLHGQSWITESLRASLAAKG